MHQKLSQRSSWNGGEERRIPEKALLPSAVQQVRHVPHDFLIRSGSRQGGRDRAVQEIQVKKNAPRRLQPTRLSWPRQQKPEKELPKCLFSCFDGHEITTLASV